MSTAYVKSVVRKYPTLCQKLDKIRAKTGKADCAGVQWGGFSRPVENLALTELPGNEQREHDAVVTAIERTKDERNGDLRLQLIEMVYWRNPIPLNAAAERLFIGYRTAKSYNRDFLDLVETALGGRG